MSEFKDILNSKELIETKTNLQKIKIILENKLEEKLEELIDLKEDLPYLLHLERIKKIKREKNE